MRGTVSFLLGMFFEWMRLHQPGSHAEPTAPVAGHPLRAGIEVGLQETGEGAGLACRSWVEIGEGAGLAEGTFCKNKITFFETGRLQGWVQIALVFGLMKTKHWIRCIRPLFLLDLDCRHATTTWLSQLHWTWRPIHSLPHASHE